MVIPTSSTRPDSSCGRSSGASYFFPEAGAEHGLSVKLETDFAARVAPEVDGIPPAHLIC
ncbi:hypothetical protein [Sagittula stellata]|uniref:hypothetical protein n=1 Tax=Sagittula stellata TaxID=52603 RepID=UPI00031FD6FB|nr:hypothetical protein [Sagittula stellata]